MNPLDYYNHNYHSYMSVPNNKVYINPNFNRNGKHEKDVSCSVSSSNVMHFNPNFSHIVNSQQNLVQHRDENIRPTIHVNPNFIQSKTQGISIANNVLQVPSTSGLTNTYNQLACNLQQETIHKSQTDTLTNVSKSRYCLVRQTDNTTVKKPDVKITTSMVKVNKYKSVSLNSLKNKLASEKSVPHKVVKPNNSNEHNLIKTRYKNSFKQMSNNIQYRYKFVKQNSVTTSLNTSDSKGKSLRRASLPLNKKVLKTNCRQIKKIIKGPFKKNNIPCPLFKKYGKCLRMAHGSCDYLHDKKHVSICRKFLRGICHDKQCLLSHDLTDKKMPTCHFYLQGMCTKEGCPYLHVKLNEKTKLCQDFVNGYCEKGDKCLNRHVNIAPATSKVICNRKQTSYQIATNTKKVVDVGKVTTTKQTNTEQQFITKNITDEESVNEHRYFQDLLDDINTTEQCDLIKPTRCKLGTLPSFIQL